MKTVFGKGNTNSSQSSNEFIKVNNMGYYKNINETIYVNRENGRLDYQLIYIDKGYGEFLLNDKKTILSEGAIILYRPFEKQQYTFDSNSDSDIFWIHFSGSEANNLLNKLKFNNSFYYIGKFYNFSQAIDNMLFYCGINSISSEIQLSGILITLLADISAKIYNDEFTFANVINAMRKDTGNSLSNKDYAKICNLSEYHFIREFKRITGLTPHKYKTKICIEKAIDLLIKTNLNVSEISKIIGFEDSLYFSKVFKQYIGMSPLNYKISKTKSE